MQLGQLRTGCKLQSKAIRRADVDARVSRCTNLNKKLVVAADQRAEAAVINHCESTYNHKQWSLLAAANGCSSDCK